MKLAIIGATGVVGSELLQTLAEYNLPISQLILCGSAASAGKTLYFQNKAIQTITVEAAIELKPQIAIFSAGASTSHEYAAHFAAVGTYVIDNSSAFRMDADKPLIVPEVNADVLKQTDKIIANPNCSTIQMVVALRPLHQLFGIRRLIISTYQAVSGTGQKAVEQYQAEYAGETPQKRVYPHPIFQNCIPQCDIFLENDYTKEEMKMVNETRKIMQAPQLAISATCVRVPVLRGHSEAINVEFELPFDINGVKNALKNTAGITVLDNPAISEYPTPLLAAHKNEVFVGRIRQDISNPQAINLWIVADNLRKGAATNAIQIAKLIIEKGWV